MYDQASRGHVLVLTEAEAKKKFPDLVIASLGAQEARWCCDCSRAL